MSYRQQKLDPNRSRLTLGGYQIVCLYDVSTPASDLPTIKMHWDSVLSSPGAKFFTVDVANFYLGPPMDRPEFIILPVKIIPQEIIDNYKLSDLENDGWVYTKIVRGMYGLPQAGKIANDLLKYDWIGPDTMRPSSYQGCGDMCGDLSPSRWSLMILDSSLK